jgi:hypothetical protein
MQKESVMSQLAVDNVFTSETASTDWQKLLRLGGAILFVQLACLLVSMVVLTIVGAEPTTAQEYFAALQENRLVGLLRLDFPTLVMIALFPMVAIALFAAFRKSRPAYGLLAMVAIIAGTLLALANHSALSILHLADGYAAAATAAERAQFLAAGEAVIAADMWHTTAGLLAGVFMQGGFAFISFVMLRSKSFGKWTAYTGILANGLDFIHLFVAFFAPALATILLLIGGVFYLFWFPLLGRDLIRLGGAEG